MPRRRTLGATAWHAAPPRPPVFLCARPMDASTLMIVASGLALLVALAVFVATRSGASHLPAHQESGGADAAAGGSAGVEGTGGAGAPNGMNGMGGRTKYGAVEIMPDGSQREFDPYRSVSPQEAEANFRRDAGPFYKMHYNDAVRMLREKGYKGEVLILRWNPDLDAPPVAASANTTVLHVNDAGIVESTQAKGHAIAQQHGTVVARLTL